MSQPKQEVKTDMSDYEKLPDAEYTANDPFNENNEIQIGSELIRFFLEREKKGRKYYQQYDAKLSEVVSYDVCEVHFCKSDLTWPLHEQIPEEFETLDTAGLVFLYTVLEGAAFFPVWCLIPLEDVPEARNAIEENLNRPHLPGLAHHGTAAAVKYILDNCEIVERISGEWYDWGKRGRQYKPNPKFRERGPDYVYCKEGMAIDFYGAGEQLEQMSAFWPWRLIRRVFPDHDELSVRYQWNDDAYVYSQQVLENEDRARFVDAAEKAMKLYHSSEDVRELLFIRPWSFPSRFHRTWDKLEPLSSKASRNKFPPIYDFVEED